MGGGILANELDFCDNTGHHTYTEDASHLFERMSLCLFVSVSVSVTEPAIVEEVLFLAAFVFVSVVVALLTIVAEVVWVRLAADVAVSVPGIVVIVSEIVLEETVRVTAFGQVRAVFWPNRAVFPVAQETHTPKSTAR